VKVVLDSSVLIAASISRAGVCAELLEDVLTLHELVISDFIAAELNRKLRDKFNFPESEVRQLRRFLRRMATAVAPTVVPTISRFSLRPSQPAHWS
jgi:predicted nucleic acid-binding protein